MGWGSIEQIVRFHQTSSSYLFIETMELWVLTQTKMQKWMKLCLWAPSFFKLWACEPVVTSQLYDTSLTSDPCWFLTPQGMVTPLTKSSVMGGQLAL